MTSLIVQDIIIHLEMPNSPKNMSFRILPNYLLLKTHWPWPQLYSTAHETSIGKCLLALQRMFHTYSSFRLQKEAQLMLSVYKCPMMGMPHWSQPCQSQYPVKAVESQRSQGCNNEAPSNQKEGAKAEAGSLNGHDKRREFNRSVQSSECGLSLLNSILYLLTPITCQVNFQQKVRTQERGGFTGTPIHPYLNTSPRDYLPC